MSTKEARKILGKDGIHLTDEEISKVISLQQAIARMCISIHKKSSIALVDTDKD